MTDAIDSQRLCILVLYYAQRTGRQRKGVGSPEGNASHGRETVASATGSTGEPVAPPGVRGARDGNETGAAMQIGVPKEIKDNENRVALTPAGVVELAHHGHQLLVERGAGIGSGFTDDEYLAAGADLADTHEEVFARAAMIMKVKEPIASEYPAPARGATGT